MKGSFLLFCKRTLSFSEKRQNCKFFVARNGKKAKNTQIGKENLKIYPFSLKFTNFSFYRKIDIKKHSNYNKIILLR